MTVCVLVGMFVVNLGYSLYNFYLQNVLKVFFNLFLLSLFIFSWVRGVPYPRFE